MKLKVQLSGTMEDKLMAVNETLKWQWKYKLLKRQQMWKRAAKQTSTAMKFRHRNLSQASTLCEIRPSVGSRDI